MKNIHDIEDKVKKERLETCSFRFEGLRMKEDEDIVVFMVWVDETVFLIKGCGEELK